MNTRKDLCKNNHSCITNALILFILACIFIMLCPSPACADVKVNALLLDEYLKKGDRDKLKFQVRKIIGGTESADWIRPGKVLVLPIDYVKPPQMHLFDRAELVLESIADEVLVTGIEITKTHPRKIPLPQQLITSASTDRTVYKRGQPVQMSLRMQNVGKLPAQIPIPTAQQYEFIVRTPGGREVWRWSSGKMFAAMLHTMIFARREEKTFTAVWNQEDNCGRKAPPGLYYVEGRIPSTPPYPVGKVKIRIK